MKSSFFGLTQFLPCALVLSGLALSGCGGGTSSQRPTATPSPNSTATPPPTTPGGAATLLNLIVFVSNRDGNNEIYSMNPNGTAQTRLTTAGAPDNSPSRARNGSRIVFSSERDGNPEIYTMGLGGDGDGLLRLTTDGIAAPDDTSPTFSADGRKIAWISTRGGGNNVWTMDSTGTNQVQFTTEGNASTPAFSPDGREIAYAVTRPLSGGTGGASSSVIVAKNIASGTERVLVQGDFLALSPRYSPNGASLVFTAQTTGSDTRRLRIVNLASGAISDGPGQGNAAGNFGIGASFSPDGSRLAFETVGAQSPQIGVSSGLSGAGETSLTSQGLNFSPAWGQ